MNTAMIEGGTWSPGAGDILLRATFDGRFLVYHAVSMRFLAGPLTVNDALDYAERIASGAIWREPVDERGRPLGDPVLITRRQPKG